MYGIGRGMSTPPLTLCAALMDLVTLLLQSPFGSFKGIMLKILSGQKLYVIEFVQC